MPNLVPRGPKIERIERFQSLQAGHYWRATKPCPAEGIELGEVLLIQSIRWVEEAPHTIILRPHPRKIGVDTLITVTNSDGAKRERHMRFTEHRFLLEDFLARFEFEPDSERVRAAEVAAVQGQIAALQNDLVETQSNPARLAAIVEAGLQDEAKKAPSAPASGSKRRASSAADAPGLQLITPAMSDQLVSLSQGSLADALTAGITPEVIGALKVAASRQHQIATIKARWIEGKTGAIAGALRALTPYYEEQAAAALALTEDVRSYVERLLDGIGSLDLYVGKGVEVEMICEGADAPAEIPLTLVQRKLLMDEELAVWAPVGEGFDFGKESEFFEALREHPGLVRQIFPTERCVLVMATTRRHIDYGEAWTNQARGAENEKVFLLVRNGENIHRVFSPVESHLGAARLFPSTNELDQIFRGVDGRNIRFEDVAYTDHLSIQDTLALHYKRFLLLACGLDHRLKLFGTFYPGAASLEFVSIDFQARYCRYLMDDAGSGNLLVRARPEVHAWINTKNAYLRAGSRVLCQYRELMNPATAPSVCKHRGEGKIDWRYTAVQPFEVTIARREGDALIVDTQVTGHTRRDYNERSFSARVNLSKVETSQWGYGDLPYLCLDAVTPEEVRYYIHHRESRREHLTYIRFFKQALIFLETERETERAARAALEAALTQGRIASGPEAVQIVEQAVIAWRAAHGGAALPAPATAQSAPWKSLLDQMYMLAGEGSRQVREVEALLAAKGLIALRLVLSGGAKLIVYAAPAPEACDDRLEPQAWVHRMTLHRGRTALTEKSRRFSVLPKSAASETTLHEWEAVSTFAARESAFASFEAKQAAFERTLHCKAELAPWGAILSKATWRELFDTWQQARAELVKKSRYVSNPHFAVPFGLSHSARRGTFSYLCVSTRVPHALLYKLAPDEAARRELRAAFLSPYANKRAAEEQFDFALSRERPWNLTRLSAEFTARRHGNFYASDWGVSESSLSHESAPDSRLSSWFAEWRRQKDSGITLWLAPDALEAGSNDAPRLLADALLGISLPSDYSPTELYEVTLMGREEGKASVYKHWFDLVPEGYEGYAVDRSLGGVSHHSNTEASIAAALRVMQAWALKSDATATLTPAQELPQAPQPPAGITRWFLLAT
jgi:hypothetical protein